MEWTNVSVSPEDLLEIAKEAGKSAYAPYSGFKVGAAVLSEKGQIVTGSNIENISYSLSVCAERNALSFFIHKKMGKPYAIAIAAEMGGECFPCGACRQFLYEFNPHMLIVIYSSEGPVIYSLSEMLPHPFIPNPDPE